MTSLSDRDASTLWIMLLTVASTMTTLALACATPFAALATLAALHMRRRDGIVLVLLAWAASQAVGFGVLGYPHDPRTLAWGVAIATAAVGSVIGAYAALAASGARGTAAKLAVAYVAAFFAYKAVLVLWSLGLGGVAISLSPKYAVDQFVRNGGILIGLYALYRALVALGVPAASPAPRTA